MSTMNFINLPEFKDQTRQKRIERPPLPRKVIMPLSQHTGAPSEPVVKVGDIVQTGSLIAQAKGFISSNLHASVSGKVVSIEDRPHPVIGSFRAIAIESDGQDSKVFLESSKEPSSLSRDEIVDIVKDAGIVGLGGAAFPTHVKLKQPFEKNIDTFIINGAECEPFLTCDHRLMLEKPKEIILGAHLIAKLLGAKDVIIGVEENKLDAIETLGNSLFSVKCQSSGVRVRVVRLKTQYPQGGERQLIKTLMNREVPSGGLPLDIGCIMSNVQTVYSIYEAIYFKKPLYERAITVTGSFVKEPRNFLVRIGTPIKDLLEFCGFREEAGVYKIIMGGPMTGVAQYSLDAPVVKGTSGILVLDKKFCDEEEVDCIRCSRCIEACPAGLMPCMIAIGAKNNRFDIAGSYDPLDCIECGSCSYVCPSKIPLVQLIQLARTKARRP